MSVQLNILLVDDDEVDVMNVQRALQEGATSPTRCSSPSNGLEALELLRDGTIPPNRRLILLDLNMPRMNGIEFLRELRKDPALAATSVVVLTTSNEERDKVEAYQLNVAGYLLKPVTFTNFVDVMADAEQVLDAGGDAVSTEEDDPVICTYDLSRLDASVVIDIMRTHPMVIIGGILQENPFYVPPDEMLRELNDRTAGDRYAGSQRVSRWHEGRRRDGRAKDAVTRPEAGAVAVRHFEGRGERAGDRSPRVHRRRVSVDRGRSRSQPRHVVVVPRRSRRRARRVDDRHPRVVDPHSSFAPTSCCSTSACRS